MYCDNASVQYYSAVDTVHTDKYMFVVSISSTMLALPCDLRYHNNHIFSILTFNKLTSDSDVQQVWFNHKKNQYV